MSCGDVHYPAVILDWAGTTIDHGSLAPVAALRRVLRDYGIEISSDEARLGMGLPKREHLRAIPTTFGAASAPDEIYPNLESALLEELAPHAALIEGTIDFVAWLRRRRIPIGNTTGYTSKMMQIVAPAAAPQGYVPGAIVTPDEAGAGRPSTAMIHTHRQRLGLSAHAAVIKIGDTPADIAEGRAAGARTIGVALTVMRSALLEPRRTRFSPPSALPVLRRRGPLYTPPTPIRSSTH
jgi:phosphonoacetaldehyde hydrolase